ncbi:hypothetical protein BC829DRAFT_98527 [Chytridium lagenaria]|nr:hypothetical protein BC829DRAFT_98527 [Chytridium lagenaria]
MVLTAWREERNAVIGSTCDRKNPIACKVRVETCGDHDDNGSNHTSYASGSGSPVRRVATFGDISPNVSAEARKKEIAYEWKRIQETMGDSEEGGNGDESLQTHSELFGPLTTNGLLSSNNATPLSAIDNIKYDFPIISPVQEDSRSSVANNQQPGVIARAKKSSWSLLKHSHSWPPSLYGKQ